MIQELSERIKFPDVSQADSSGLLAVGGDLSPERILEAYKSGIFPWFNPGEIIQWWAPDPRFVLFPSELKISKSTKKILRDDYFEFTENQNFKEIITCCSLIKREGQAGTWITKEMIKAYCILYEKGLAKSVEVWKEGKLAGGFYGIDLGIVFCGESMFSNVSNASKCGFTYFVNKYKDKYQVIDCQVYTSYLEQFGAREIPLSDFLSYLDSAAVKNLHFK